MSATLELSSPRKRASRVPQNWTPAFAGVTTLLVHPGRILKRELAARHMTVSAFAGALKLPESRVRGIVAGRRRIDVEAALRLARYFGNSPQFWMNLQTGYELALAERKIGARVRAQVRRAA